MKTVKSDDVELAKQEADRIASVYLEQNGWKYSCDFPGAIWLYSKMMADGSTVATDRRTAVYIQSMTTAADAPHNDDIAVTSFTAEMREKMRYSRVVKRRSGWDNPAKCSTSMLANELIRHVEKGDIVDVANFCMMLHSRESGAAMLRLAMVEYASR